MAARLPGGIFLLWFLLCTATAHGQFDLTPRIYSTDELTLAGRAVHTGDEIQLTPSERRSAGAMWHVERQTVIHGFRTEFFFRITDPGGQEDFSDEIGGDGFAFVIQGDTAGALGEAGGGIGYSSIPNSLAVEFDTWDNGPIIDDPDNNHISVHSRGTQPNSSLHVYALGGTSDIIDIADGRLHSGMISYMPGRLDVYIDHCHRLSLMVDVDLEELLSLEDGRAWVGFTSATGSSWERHNILSWSFRPLGINPDGPIAFCEGDSVTLRVPPGFENYRWSTGDTTPQITVVEGGTYRLEYGPWGCTDLFEASVEVEVLAPPLPEIIGGDTIRRCPDAEATLIVAAPYESYLWSTGADTRFITVDAAGNYFVDVVDSNGCSGTSREIVVIDISPPEPVISPSDTIPICAGMAVELDAGGGYASYRWSTGETSRTIEAATPGDYYVEVTDQYGCKGRSAPVTLVTEAPRPRIAASDSLRLCPGAALTLDAGGGYASYHWSTGETSRTIVIASAGQFFVDVVTADGCRGRSDTVTILPFDKPTLSPDGPLTFCEGESVVLSAGQGYTSYLWSTGETSESITVRSEGRYSVTVSDGKDCAAFSDTLTVTTLPLPKPTIHPAGPMQLCDGASLELSAPEGYTDYLWSNGERSRVIMVDDSGLYSVTVTDAAGCVGTSDPVRVESAFLTLDTLPMETTICAGTRIQLSAPEGYAEYRWQPAEGLSCNDCREPEAAPLRTTTYYLTVSNGDGCTGQDSTTIWVDETPEPVGVAIPTSLRAAPGSSVRVPVLLEDAIDGAGISRIELEIGYPSDIMRPIDVVQENGLLADWSIEQTTELPGAYRLSLSAPPGASLTGTGPLLHIRFSCWLGNKAEAELPLSIIFDGDSCVSATPQPGRLLLDSLCGLTYRLIELSATEYALSSIHPNPFNPTTTIRFSLGLEGPTTLEILDSRGRRAAILMENRLSPGVYAVQWNAAGFPSGLYYCRLRSGHWNALEPLLLVK